MSVSSRKPGDVLKTIVWRPLSEDQNYSQSIYKGKWSKSYAKYLLGVESPKTEASPLIDNKQIWEAKFQIFFRTGSKPTTGKFSSVNKATGDEEGSLSKVCSDAYKANKENVTDKSSNDVKFKEEEVWKFCSYGGTKIKTIEEVSKEKTNLYIYSGKIGEKYKDSLVSSADVNNWFWDLKQKELKEYSGKLSEGGFKEVNNKLNNGSAGTYDTIKNVCSSIYEKDKNEITNIKDDLFRFCSLTGEAPSEEK